jgi:PEP-CTERM motif
MRAAPFLAALALMWAGSSPTRAAFKVKFTRLADIQTTADWRPAVPDPTPAPPGAFVLTLTPAGGLPCDFGPWPPGLSNVPGPPPDFAGAGKWGPGGPPGGGANGPGMGGEPARGPQAQSAPEPASVVLAAIGVVGLAGYARRRRKDIATG